jgi:hypothetical protein
MFQQIGSWADEYDSDMESEWNLNNETNETNNKTNNEIKNIIEKDDKNDEKYFENIFKNISCQTLKTRNIFYKFPSKISGYKCSIDYNLFYIVDNSEYSCLMPWYVNQVNKSFSDIYKFNDFKVEKIVDAGANIGVDSINLLQNFPKSKLITFEIDIQTYSALCKNLISFNILTNINNIEQLTNTKSQVQSYNGNFLEHLEHTYNSDIVFIDAPWGGKNYKNKKDVSIFLQPESEYSKLQFNNSNNIIHITKLLLQSYNVKSVILKVPYNYEFYKFKNTLNTFNKNIKIIYKNIYKGNSNHVSFVLIFVFNI